MANTCRRGYFPHSMVRFGWSSAELTFSKSSGQISLLFSAVIVNGNSNKTIKKSFDFIRWLMEKPAQLDALVNRVIQSLRTKRYLGRCKGATVYYKQSTQNLCRGKPVADRIPNIKDTLLCYGVRQTQAREWNILLQLYNSQTRTNNRLSLLQALACTTQDDLLLRYESRNVAFSY